VNARATPAAVATPAASVPTRAAVTGPTLFAGEVIHHRLRPAENRFRYGVFFVALPLSRLVAAECRWFGINRARLLSVWFSDYGPGDGTHPRVWLDELLAREGIAADGEIVLQTFPRFLGYVFNPVSFWHCHDRAGSLRAVVCEVNNTFGERHLYLLAHADGRALAAGETLAARKVFHVSPFLPVAGNYAFRFRLGADRALARIDYTDGEGALLRTSVSGSALPWTPAVLLRTVVTHPLMTVGIMARIHWQALRLWLKRVRFFSKPAPPVAGVTRGEGLR
jgi:DUF1365 family protein